MIEAHTIDAWTRAASKDTIAFRNATVLGGFAAPLFLWLAGIAVVLAAERTVQKTGDRRAALDAVVRRGLAMRGDRVIVTAGVPFDVPGSTNTMKIETV